MKTLAALALTAAIVLTPSAAFASDNLKAGITRYNKANPSHFGKAKLARYDKILRHDCTSPDAAFAFEIADLRDNNGQAAIKALRMVCPAKVKKADKAIDG